MANREQNCLGGCINAAVMMMEPPASETRDEDYVWNFQYLRERLMRGIVRDCLLRLVEDLGWEDCRIWLTHPLTDELIEQTFGAVTILVRPSPGLAYPMTVNVLGEREISVPDVIYERRCVRPGWRELPAPPLSAPYVAQL